LNVYGKTAVILIRAFLHTICKVDRKELKQIPRIGPYIVAINHINSLEVPLLVVDLAPRKVHGVAKKETWNNPFVAWLAGVWEVISIDREGMSLSTFKEIAKVLKKKESILVAPEGTRTGDGKLKKAHPGIIIMALKANVPIIPVVHFGGERFWDNISKFKRTKFSYRVGKPLRITTRDTDQEIRQELADQLMYRMARLLPKEYRGVYSEIDKIDNKYAEDIEFDDLRNIGE
jgi:1-acyl-sn-glycerol-3-phosphate acyltransferase